MLRRRETEMSQYARRVGEPAPPTHYQRWVYGGVQPALGGAGNAALLVRLPGAALTRDTQLEFEAAVSGGDNGRPLRCVAVTASSDSGTTHLGGGAPAGALAPQYALARHNKRTKCTTLYPVAGPVVSLRPMLDSEVAEAKKARAEEATKRAAESRPADEERAAKRALVDAFGSTKSGRKLKSAERALVKAEKLSQVEVLTGLVSNIAGKSRSQVDEEAAEAARNVPPHDASAQTVEGCYPLDKLCDDDEWGCLDAKLLLTLGRRMRSPKEARGAQRQAEEEGWCSLVIARLASLADPETTTEARDLRARVLWMLQAHVAFYKGGGSSGGTAELSEKLGVPELVAAGLLDRFMTPQGTGTATRYARSKRQHQLCGLYIAVLLLHLDGFAFDAIAYGDELKLGTKDVNSRLREMGCFVERKRLRTGTTAVARLKAPLTFPKIKRGAAPKK